VNRLRDYRCRGPSVEIDVWSNLENMPYRALRGN